MPLFVAYLLFDGLLSAFLVLLLLLLLLLLLCYNSGTYMSFMSLAQLYSPFKASSICRLSHSKPIHSAFFVSIRLDSIRFCASCCQA